MGEQIIVSDGVVEAIGGGVDASEGVNALGGEGEASVEDEGVGVGVVREEVYDWSVENRSMMRSHRSFTRSSGLGRGFSETE